MFTKRSAPRYAGEVEGGPIRIATGPQLGTHWSAVAFTLAVAVALVYGATRASEFLPAARSTERVQATPAPATPAPTAPAAASLASAWISQTPAPVIAVGGTAKITFTFRNAGSATWVKGTPSEVRLGVTEPYEPGMALDWPDPDRAAVQNEAVVGPGQLVTFTFEVQGTKPGTFRFDLRPVVDGVGWLTDQGVYTTVEVRPASGSTP